MSMRDLKIIRFFHNYWLRHCNPFNLFLHLIGIPLTVFGFVQIFNSSIIMGLTALILGFSLQYWGHLIQGSKMGEIYLLEQIFARKEKF